MRQALFIFVLLFACAACGSKKQPVAKKSASAGSTTTTTITPSPITSTPASNTFLYRASPAANKIFIGSINLATGAISEHSPFSTGTGTAPADIAVTPDHKFAYVAKSGGSDIALYSLDQTTGAMTFISNSSTYAGPAKLAMDPSGRFLFAFHTNNAQIKSYLINSTTGALTVSSFLAPGSTGVRALAVDPTGNYLYASTDQHLLGYSVDQTTGVLTDVGVNFVLDAGKLLVNPAGTKLYYAQWLYNYMGSFLINAGGVITSFAQYTGHNVYYSYSSIAFHPTGNYFYAANSTVNTLESYSVDPGTGALTYMNTGTLPSGCAPTTLQVVPSHEFIYLSCNNGGGQTIGFPLLAGGQLGASYVSSVSTGLSPTALTIVEF